MGTADTNLRSAAGQLNLGTAVFTEVCLTLHFFRATMTLFQRVFFNAARPKLCHHLLVLQVFTLPLAGTAAEQTVGNKKNPEKQVPSGDVGPPYRQQNRNKPNSNAPLHSWMLIGPKPQNRSLG